MKITKSYLKQVIKEELEKLQETSGASSPTILNKTYFRSYREALDDAAGELSYAIDNVTQRNYPPEPTLRNLRNAVADHLRKVAKKLDQKQILYFNNLLKQADQLLNIKQHNIQ